MTDIEYMKQALVEAQKAYDEDEVPIGAVIVCKGRIIARAHNLRRCSTT
jgi:tRNA(adenine34) deaminase